MLERILTHGSWPPDVEIYKCEWPSLFLYVCVCVCLWRVWHLSTIAVVVHVGQSQSERQTPCLLVFVSLDFGVVSSSGFQSSQARKISIFGIYFMLSNFQTKSENCWQFSILILRTGRADSVSRPIHCNSSLSGRRFRWNYCISRDLCRQSSWVFKFIGLRPKIHFASLAPTTLPLSFSVCGPQWTNNKQFPSLVWHIYKAKSDCTVVCLMICTKGCPNINPFGFANCVCEWVSTDWTNIKHSCYAVIAWLISGQTALDTNDYLMLQFTLYWFAYIWLCLCQHNRGIMSSCHGHALN